MKVFRKIKIVTAFIIFLPLINSCDTPSHISAGVHYTNPSWAPPYFNGVRYYYLPDIEVYYDLSDQEFVYLDNGQWLFSSALPPVFSNYDPYNGFVIALNLSVYQPWMHHQYYVSHYPRFYYHNVYRGMDITSIRGFNENERKTIYWKPEDRNRANDLRKNDKMERKAGATRQPQKTNYYGKGIGQPVKVRPQMKEKKSRKGRGRPE